MGEESVEPLLEGVYERLNAQGLCKVEVEGKRMRVGVVDGSGIGGQLASFLMLLGEVPTILALQRLKKKGKELPVTLRMLRQTPQRWGRGFLSLVLGDGLYPTTSFWKTCQSIGSDGVVKTDEITLSIVQDANGIFDAPQLLPGVDYITGTDAERGCRYRLWAVEALPWSNTEITLKVARVEETYLKGKRAGQTIRFWVLSQNQSLNALTLRKLAHWRWFIENNGFKALNEQVHSKHLFSHNPHAALVIAHLQLIGFMLLQAYRVYLQYWKNQLKTFFDHGALSLQLLRNRLRSSIEFIGWNTT
jgi:hypothetical protein